jgi:putative DNA primase/helicase
LPALDVLDTSISLRRPTDYSPTEGARFEVHIEKGRGIHGEHARPFEAQLAIVDGRTEWTMKQIEDVERARIAALLDLGFSIRSIAEETGIHRSKVLRLKQRIEGEAAEAGEAGPAAAAGGPDE